MNYWIFKSEPDTFSIDDLKNRDRQIEPWNGVRNYQARNFIRDNTKIGDKILFHHSSCKTPGIAGIAEIVSAPYPDHTAFDTSSPYFDAKSKKENPAWYMVDVKFVKKFNDVISLNDLKNHERLQDLILLRKGNRLSIMPITKEEFEYITSLR